jgi:transcriptional regulator with XRE-family HTH domain
MAAPKNRLASWGFDTPHLEAWRRWRVLSQRELAVRSGLSSGYLSRLEAGCKRAAPATIGRLADALDISREQLVRHQPPTT